MQHGKTMSRGSVRPSMGLLLVLVWCLSILSLASPAQAQWPAEISAGNIRCHANFELEPYQELLTEIGALQEDLSEQLGVSPARESIHLYLFHHQSVYKSYLQKYFPEVPYRRALFMKSRGPGMVFAHLNEEFAVDVRHESTHALLHATLPMVPLWLDEGLAEYFEVPREQRAYANPHLGQTKWSARLGLLSKIEQLEQLRKLNDMGRTEYRNAWAWVHFMLHGPPAAHDELMRFLADIEAHVPPGKLSDRLRRRIPNLDRAMAEHFQTWQAE
jgi:hypothetical protein